MSENLQQSLFGSKLDLKPSLVYQGGSHASHTALRESVRHLLTSVISGRSSGALLAKLGLDGSWLKMCGDCCQANMDGSFEEYSEILPTWGLMLGGQLIQPQRLEPYIDESEWRLLPTPTADLEKGYSADTARRATQGILSRKSGVKFGSSLNWTPAFLASYRPGKKNHVNPLLLEAMMGFPPHWTDVDV